MYTDHLTIHIPVKIFHKGCDKFFSLYLTLSKYIAKTDESIITLLESTSVGSFHTLTVLSSEADSNCIANSCNYRMVFSDIFSPVQPVVPHRGH